MPRKGPAPRRELMPDPVYRSVLVTQVINKVLQRGKRSTAEKIMYDALTLIEQKTGVEPVATLKRAVDNVRPQLEVRSRRVGGRPCTLRRRGWCSSLAASLWPRGFRCCVSRWQPASLRPRPRLPRRSASR